MRNIRGYSEVHRGKDSPPSALKLELELSLSLFLSFVFALWKPCFVSRFFLHSRRRRVRDQLTRGMRESQVLHLPLANLSAPTFEFLTRPPPLVLWESKGTSEPPFNLGYTAVQWQRTTNLMFHFQTSFLGVP